MNYWLIADRYASYDFCVLRIVVFEQRLHLRTSEIINNEYSFKIYFRHSLCACVCFSFYVEVILCRFFIVFYICIAVRDHYQESH